MDRRAFIVGGAAVLAAPLAAEEQQAGKVYRIGSPDLDPRGAAPLSQGVRGRPA
jgi:hypothetical protein